MKTFYFIAGLPRSGATLLSAILNQNPKFYSGPNSPVLNMILAIDSFKYDEMFLADPRQDSLDLVKTSIIYNFYHYQKQSVIFDKNRGWTKHIDIIQNNILTNNKPKIICTVRNVKEILTSFIVLLRQNNYTNKSFLYDSEKHKNDDDICLTLLTTGIVGNSIKGMLEIYDKHPDKIHLINYDDLVFNTEKSMKSLYKFLEEEYLPLQNSY